MLAGLISARRQITLVEVEAPRLTASAPSVDGGEILFQPELACLCGSDLPFFDRDEGSYPRELGHSLHEMIGRVVETNGRRFRPGDRVLAVPVNQLGLFQRYVVSEERAIPLDPRVADDCAVLAQPLGTALFALRKLPPVIDQTVAVVGQGPMGQLFCGALRNLGAREIIAIDRLPARLANSPRMGATAVVCNAVDDPVEAVRELSDGAMADVVIEAVGHADQAFNLCIDLCRHAGRILFFGVPDATIDGLEWRKLFFKNLTVQTSVNPDFRRDFPLAMQWIAERRIDVSSLVTHRFPLAEIQRAFETFQDRVDGALKVLLDFPNYDG